MSTFLQTYERFLTFKSKRIKPNTFKGYKTLRTHIENNADLAEMQFEEVGLIDLQLFIDGIDLRQSTLQNFKIYLSQYYKWAKKYGYGGNVNISDIELPYQPKTRNDRNLQIIELDKFSKSPCELELKLIYLTGCRLGECLALRYDDFNFNNMSISINKTWTRYGISSPKTPDSIRTIPLPPQLIPLIEGRMKDISKVYNGYLMVNPNTGKIKSPVTLDNAIKKIYPDISIHYLRHYYISKAVQSNINIQALKRLVGHSKGSQTIEKIYLHMGQDFINSEYDKIKF